MKKMHFIITIMVGLIAILLNAKTVLGMSLDEIQNQEVVEYQEQGPHYWPGKEPQTITQSNSDDALKDYLKGYSPITEENMQNAAITLSPVVTAIGNLIGIIVVMTVSLIFLVTAIDLLYISVPSTRSVLNPSESVNFSQGMTGGFVNGQLPQTPKEYGLRRKWVSDEASYVVRKFSAQASSPSITPVMGMQPAQQPMKIVIFEYFKMRAIFLVIFAITTVMLLSSVFTDCGLNIAALLVKLVAKLNVSISGIAI